MAAPNTGGRGRGEANGVLPVSHLGGNVSKGASTKTAGPRLKVIIRRLAPALTEAEFLNILGEEWKVGQGKVDWFMYKPGKDSKDASKQSRPSRAYLHLLSDSHLVPLSEAVRSLSFEDAQNTYTSSALIGPPVVEFAPYGRVPGGRKRSDARQGTIDQDPEFMDFLESLINPVTTKEEVEETIAQEKGQKVTTTPLVQFLKDKKARKTKDNEAAKAAKQAGKQDVKAIAKPTKDGKSEELKKSGKESKKERLLEKATREAVKIAHKDGAKAGTAQASTTPAAASASVDAPKNARAPRERGSIAAAARILQRDLGLSPGNAHRKAKQDAANAAKATSTEGTSSSATPNSASSPNPRSGKGKGSQNAGGDTDSAAKSSPVVQPVPIMLLRKPAASTDPSTAAASRPSSASSTTATAPTATPTSAPTSTPSTQPKTQPAAPTNHRVSKATPPIPTPSTPTATRAFIKHANPSQGVTETLLKTAMEAFGKVNFVEMDRKKGFAYVDFGDNESLKKAMSGSPVKVGEAMCVVLERKEARGGGGGGGSGGAAGASGGASTGGGGGGGGRGGHGGHGHGSFPRGGGGRGGGRRGGRGGNNSGSAAASPAAASNAPPTKG